MKQKENIPENQVMYLGRWVNKDTFRAFVYNEKEEKLAKNYVEFEKLIESGLWFPEKPGFSAKVRKTRNDTNR